MSTDPTPSRFGSDTFRKVEMRARAREGVTILFPYESGRVIGSSSCSLCASSVFGGVVGSVPTGLNRWDCAHSFRLPVAF